MSEENTAVKTSESPEELEAEIEQIQSQHKRYLSPKEIVAFCIVNLGQKNLDEFINTKMQFFLIQFFGLSSTALANIQLATQIYDAVDDTISGIVIDRTRTRWGRVKPYLILPMPLWIIATLMLFSTPDLTNTGKIIWVSVAILLRGLGMSYFGAWYLILYNNTPNLKERNDLITTSEFVKLFGTFFASTLPIFLDIGKIAGISEPSMYKTFSVLIVILATATSIYGFFNMRERIPLQSREEMNEVSVWKSIKLVLSNRPMFTLVFANIFNGFKSVGGAVETFFWFNCTGAYSYATLAGLFTGLPNYIMTPLAGKWMNKYGARNVAISGALFGGLAYLGMWLVGYAPFGGSFKSNVVMNMIWLTFALTVCGLPNSILRVTMPALTGDLYDYMEWKTGLRNEGLVSTVSGYFQKFGYSFNSWVGNMVLTWIGYKPLLDPNGMAIPQTDLHILKGLWFVFALAPAAARFLTGIAFMFFSVHGKFKKQMLIDLEERREKRLQALKEEQENTKESADVDAYNGSTENDD